MKRKLVTALKFYLAFALCNSFYKIGSYLYALYRARRLWKHIPGRNIDPTGKDVRKNVNNVHDFLIRDMKKYPEADLIKLGTPSPVLLCNTPKAVKWLLKDEFGKITKPGSSDPSFWFLRKFLGPKGIFVLRHGDKNKEEGKEWLQQRKVASLIFTKSNFMTTFHETFVEKSKTFLKRLENEEGKVIDIQEIFFSFTMDSIEKFFFGTDVNTVEGGMSNYAKAFDGAQAAMQLTMRSNILPLIIGLLILPFPFGSLVSLPESSLAGFQLCKTVAFGLSPHYKRFKDNCKILEEHISKYVKKTRDDPNIGERKDIIANFLNSKIGNELSDKTLKDIVLNLTIAGRDTTACALSWMTFELTQHKDVQNKLCEEIDEVLKGRVPKLSDLEPKQMPYLNGVVYEVLRLHPPVPTDTKITESDVLFNGTLIPSGTKLVYSPHGMGRNPKYFTEPLKFDPHRWIPFKQPDLYDFPVFQAGPRFCLGKDMAIFEMKLLMVMLLQKFKFELKEGEEKKIGYSLMITQSIANNEKKDNCVLLVIPKRR